MASKQRAIYWDTSVFLCFLRKHESERRAICEDILRHARDGKVSLYTSSFTVTEVIKPLRMETTGPRPLSSDEVEDLQGMFHWPWLKKIALDRLAQDAVNLGLTFALTAAEAIHAASAIVAKVDVLQQWERSAALERVNRLVAVEAPQCSPMASRIGLHRKAIFSKIFTAPGPPALDNPTRYRRLRTLSRVPTV